MDAERWQRVAQLYDEVGEQPQSQRQAFLARACEGDDDLQREVESLLAQDVSRDGPMERVAAAATATRPSPVTIGRYRILRPIGEGGMGVVYEAEQDSPRRTVALKVVKSVLAAPDLARRFARESEALGRLQHPGIARIYEAGSADGPLGAQPYLAMEFIQGVPLVEYANEHRLDVRGRLELLTKVCDAVDHAHQRGVIHRDLKPGNILVDQSGQPKILDFGVARIADDRINASFQTRIGDIVGTLAYMSPEHLAGDPSLLDARSDVYSLGVVLYELLAGRLPYDVGRQLTDAARAVREEDPTSLRTISRTYRGDLETIAGKALEKDKARRYVSAGELAEDLRRHLDDRPILATQPTAAYQARKFVRRHRGLVASTAAVLAVLVAGIAVSTVEAVRARRDRDRARRAEQVAAAVNTFLQDDLLAQAGARAQASAQNRPDPNLTVRAALDRAAARIGARFDSQPVVEAAIRRTIGLAYSELGLYADAQSQLEAVAGLRARVLGPENPETVISLDELGVLYNSQAKYKEAEALLSKVVDARKKQLGNLHPDTLAAMSHLALAIAYEGDDVRAAEAFAALLDVERRVHGDAHPDTLEVMDDLGVRYLKVGKYAEGVALLERELEISRRVRGPDHPTTLNGMHNLATAYRGAGRYAEADRLFAEVLHARQRALGDDHWEIENTRMSLAISYRAQGRYAEAEPLFTEAVGRLQHLLPPDHPLTLQGRYHLGEMYRRAGKRVEAESALTAVAEARTRVLGVDNAYTAQALTSVGALWLDEQKYAKAEAPLRDALRVREKTAPDGWELFQARALLGAALAGLGRHDEADGLLTSGYRGLLDREAAIPAEYHTLIADAHRWLDHAQ